MQLLGSSMSLPIKALFLANSFLGFVAVSMANPLEARQTTSSLSSTTATPSSSDTSTASADTTSASSQASVDSVTTSTTAAPTVSGATTISGTDDPDLVTATQTSSGSDLPANATSIPDKLRCTEADSKSMGFPPFCQPGSGTQKVVGSTYFVTWFPDAFTQGTLISVQLNYPNTTETPWHSDFVDKNRGLVNMPIDSTLLQGNSQNNVSLFLIANNPNETTSAKTFPGPTITVVQPSTSHYPPPAPTTFDKLGLMIGLPIGLAVILLVIAVTFFGMRKHRQIGLGNIMGRRKGYGVGKSRRQRVGKRGAIGLAEQDFDQREPGFSDEPGADVELEQRYRDGERGGNVFQEEVQRQRTGR